MLAKSLLLPGLAAGLALLLVDPTQRAGGFVLNGSSLGTQQRDVRVFDNFTDPESNDNLLVADQYPGALGLDQALWKGIAEWGSTLHGTGKGDPIVRLIGNGGANFDGVWMGNASSVGGINQNVVSAIANCPSGIIAFADLPSNNGWRITFCDGNFIFDDGPARPFSVDMDLQSVMAHEYGHAVGLGHSTEVSSTMWAMIAPGGVRKRSLHADDIAGVQAIYGSVDPGKPLIWKTDGNGGSGTLTITGLRFDPVDNDVWFTPAATTDPADDPRVRVFGVPSTDGGRRIDVAIPIGAGPGDIAIKTSATTGGLSLSNAFPSDLIGENVSTRLAPFGLVSLTPSVVEALDPGTTQSLTISGYQLDTTTSIELNSVPVDPARWTAVDSETITVDLPQGLLGANTLEVSDGVDTVPIPLTIVEPASPKYELGTGDPANVIANGGQLSIIVAGRVGTLHRVYYSTSNLPSVHPRASFDIGNGFSNLLQGAVFTIGSEGYTQFSAPVAFGGGSPMVFYSQSIDVSTPPAPQFGVSNLQSITLVP